MGGPAFDEQLEALEQERASVDLEGWGVTEVRGADAEGWLNDLVTAPIDRLAEGEPAFDQIGQGYFAVLIDQGEGTIPYQGMTPLAGGSLAACAQTYFK